MMQLCGKLIVETKVSNKIPDFFEVVPMLKKKLLLLLAMVILVMMIVACATAASEGTSKISQSETSATEKENMPQLQDMVTNGEKCAVLAVDGSVWVWDEGQDVEEAVKLAGLENITELLCAGPAMYALSGDGDVYVWGSNELWQIDTDQDRDVYFAQPIRIAALSDVVELDVSPDRSCGKGRLFAIDSNGSFWMSGLYLYGYEEEYQDFIPGFPERNRGQVEGVASVFAGSGSYHYFIRDNGSVFSIMDSVPHDRPESLYITDFLFPQLPVEEHEQTSEYVYLTDNSYEDLREGTKYGTTILYELGHEGQRITDMDADCYTMFLSREDGTLWYWESDMIKYHDRKYVMVDPEYGAENYAGSFQQVDVAEILDVSDEESTPRIVDMCAGNENFLFLTDDGRVLVSSYATYEVRDVKYYDITSTNPNRERVLTAEDFPLKIIQFEALDWENIISINTDGEYQFTAVDAHGEYYHLDLWP